MKIKPKKSLGQNFLRDNTFIEKILTCTNLPNATEIIEIGPGDGALTNYLANTNKKFRGIEIDSDVADDIGRSLILEQVKLGVAVRMAVINKLLLET